MNSKPSELICLIGKNQLTCTTAKVLLPQPFRTLAQRLFPSATLPQPFRRPSAALCTTLPQPFRKTFATSLCVPEEGVISNQSYVVCGFRTSPHCIHHWYCVGFLLRCDKSSFNANLIELNRISLKSMENQWQINGKPQSCAVLYTLYSTYATALYFTVLHCVVPKLKETFVTVMYIVRIKRCSERSEQSCPERSEFITFPMKFVRNKSRSEPSEPFECSEHVQNVRNNVRSQQSIGRQMDTKTLVYVFQYSWGMC